jgi:hypothetical protein
MFELYKVEIIMNISTKRALCKIKTNISFSNHLCKLYFFKYSSFIIDSLIFMKDVCLSRANYGSFSVSLSFCMPHPACSVLSDLIFS